MSTTPKQSDMNYFARNIRFLRNQGGLRQAEMLDKIGVARTTWSSYENDVSQPDIDGLLKIAYFFGITVTELLEVDLKAKEHSRGSHAVEQKERSRKSDGTISEAQLPLSDGLLFDVIRAKQQVIETQAQTIGALQALIEHLTVDEKRFDSGDGQKKGLRPDGTEKDSPERTKTHRTKNH